MRPAVPVYLEEPKINRVTLTLPVLNHAAQVLFLASGRAKAGAVHEIVEDGNPKQYPAGLVQPLQSSAVWMIDREASSALAKPLHTSV
jgi:6-phosphogluconolactonase